MALALPDDALAAVLGRLPPQGLAACRCVCKAWRAIVDGHGLLLPHVLPHAVRGIFVNHRRPRFFARPSSPAARPAIDGSLDFLPGYITTSSRPILDHCNGLLLYGYGRELYVVNPATRRWQGLPPRVDMEDGIGNAYLAFDPAVSPHYEVLLIPPVPEKSRPIHPRYALPIGSRKIRDGRPISPREKRGGPTTTNFSSLDDTSIKDTKEDERREEDQPSPAASSEPDEEGSLLTSLMSWLDSEPEDPYGGMEWPPSPYAFHIFSSSTGRWEKRSFLREGEAIGTVEDARLDTTRPTYCWGPRWRHAVYWQGTLYVHCRGAFIMRLSLMNDKYQVLRTPVDIKEGKYTRPFLGRSKNGVYFATFDENCLLRIWVLYETYGNMEWVFKHNVDLEHSTVWAATHMNNHQRIGPWILKDNTSDEYNNNKMVSNENFEWDSDDDNVIDHVNGVEDRDQYVYFLGFHPYKEVVFLQVSFAGVAFHLNTSKVQYLGKLCTKHYHCTFESFPYTPCLIGEFPEYSQETQPEHQQYM